ncbi:MAG TPA: ion channel [Myxococcales bacterium]|nr:ion channel [Myxococcales bacterium]
MTRTEELTDFVCAASALFLCAEEGHNPSVRTFWDALHYVSTSLSVGYANIYPVTQAGKAIGAVVQMVGPALSSRALDPGGAAGLLREGG